MKLTWTPSAVLTNGRKKKLAYDCPKCRARLSHRVHRHGFIKVFLFWLPLKKYQCLKCLDSCYVLAINSVAKAKSGQIVYKVRTLQEVVPGPTMAVRAKN